MTNSNEVIRKLEELRQQIKDAFKASAKCVAEVRSRNDMSPNALGTALFAQDKLEEIGKVDEEIVERHLKDMLGLANLPIWLEIIEKGQDDSKPISEELINKINEKSLFLKLVLDAIKNEEGAIQFLRSQAIESGAPVEATDDGTLRISSVMNFLWAFKGPQ